MSLSVARVQISDVTAELELAERMAGHGNVARKSLECFFQGAMQGIEKLAGQQFDSSLKERVWNKVSKENLKSLKEYFLSEFCEKILGVFDTNEVEEMLEEHKRTGIICSCTYPLRIGLAYATNHSVIMDSVQIKAKSMTDNWIPEIVKAVREEGIELPIM